MNEAEKQAAIEAAGAQIREAQKALQAGINALSAAIDIVVSAPPVLEPVPEPIPTSAGPITATIGTVVGKTFSIPADNYVAKDQVTAQFANGRKSHVVAVYTVADTMYVTTSEQGSDSPTGLLALIGSKVKIFDRADAKPSNPAPVVVPPVVDTPAPVVTPPVVTSPASDLPAWPIIISGKKGAMGCNGGMGAGGTQGPSSYGIPGLPGTNGHNFTFCTDADLDTILGEGIYHVRAGTVSERLWDVKDGKPIMRRGKDSRGNNFVAEEILRCAASANARNMRMMWDIMHNYGKHSFTDSDAGAKSWGEGDLTEELHFLMLDSWFQFVLDNPVLRKATRATDMMNEWSGSTTVAWIVRVWQRIISKWGVLLPEMVFSLNTIQYSNTQNFASNSALFATLKHPTDQSKLEFSPHLYNDAQSSGYFKPADKVTPKAIADVVGQNRLKPFLEFIKPLGVGFNVGEIMMDGEMTVMHPGFEATASMVCENGGIAYIFGVSANFGDNHHNLMIPLNAPVRAIVRRLAAKYK